MAKRTLEQKSQKKVQNTKYMTMCDKIKSVRIGEYAFITVYLLEAYCTTVS